MWKCHTCPLCTCSARCGSGFAFRQWRGRPLAVARSSCDVIVGNNFSPRDVRTQPGGFLVVESGPRDFLPDSPPVPAMPRVSGGARERKNCARVLKWGGTTAERAAPWRKR